MKRMEFEGKVVLVTGASKGIGRGVARAFVDQGASVAVCSRNWPSLESLVKEVEASGKKILAMKADVSSSRDVEDMFGKVLARWNRLDILVNNAGIVSTSPVVEMSEEDWDLTLAVDLKGVFLCSRAAARQMIRQKSGRIVNISSIAQVRGGTMGRAHYGAAKAGVGAFTKTLAKEVGLWGITVNCVAPGQIEDTEMAAASRAKLGEDYFKALLATVPLGYFGKVRDIAEAVLFLASDRARYITGETLNVNGGMYMA
jgi:3-oxoacyl-[acyl-carrier protein] reductase